MQNNFSIHLVLYILPSSQKKCDILCFEICPRKNDVLSFRHVFGPQENMYTQQIQPLISLIERIRPGESTCLHAAHVN